MAKFSIAPAQMPQDRWRGDAHIVGYYGYCVRVHQDGEDIGPGYYVILSRILQVDFGENLFHALR